MLIALFGLVTGIALGLTGGGGSIFAMPLLLSGAGSSVPQAVAVSSLAVGSASLVGALRGLHQGWVDVRSGIMFAAAGIITAPLGVLLGARLDDSLRLGAFSVLLLVMGGLMWHKAHAPESRVVRASILRGSGIHGAPSCRYSLEGKLHMTAPCAAMLAGAGVTTGLLSGLFGVGGGFLIVPALRLTTGLSIHRSVATSLLVIASISASTAVSSSIGIAMDLPLTFKFVGGSITGLIAGALLAQRLAGPPLQRLFAALIAAVGLGMLAQILID